jgi:hypothetical protein
MTNLYLISAFSLAAIARALSRVAAASEAVHSHHPRRL